MGGDIGGANSLLLCFASFSKSVTQYCPTTNVSALAPCYLPPVALLQARLFVGAGVDKIRLTGGEPTLRPGGRAGCDACVRLGPGTLPSHCPCLLPSCPLLPSAPAAPCQYQPSFVTPHPPTHTHPHTHTPTADLVELPSRLSALPGVRAVGLTSNGLTLGRKLQQLKDAGGARQSRGSAGNGERAESR